MSLRERRRYAAGITILLGVVIIWVSSSFLMNHIFEEQKYNKPFAITYMNTASFSLYLLNLLFKKKRTIDKQRILDFNHALYDTNSRSSIESISDRSVNSNEGDGMNDHNMYSTPQSSTYALGLHNDINSFSMRTHRPTGIRHYIDPHDLLSSVRDEEKLRIREVARLSFSFCVLWFAANWCTNASLAYTTVASSTILASTSAPDENQHNPINHLFGDSLALIGAFFYGCYTVLLKLRIQDESRINMPLFFGFVGLYNIFLLWPFFLLLHVTGVEEFQLPPDGNVWIMIMVNALVGTFLSDYLWLLSVLLTSPLVVTLGLSLTIPLALFGDYVFKGIIMNPGYWLGALLVVGGFLGVNLETVKERKHEHKFTSLLIDEPVTMGNQVPSE
ncbi:109_t:CDS:2 [Acaulospora morrowiae]|uniref:109_t:CDS:1 n=1 Tax=Acaulospora morrowiae TaxID=94023 RepID=A0A9N9EDG0_9GLOM|nr:109_t:CDS:2 [Acaulospora morrowiae]